MCGGVVDIINEDEAEKAGYLLSANPMPEEICRIICTYIELPEYMKKELNKNAYDKWNNLFYAEKNAEMFVEIIKSVL